MDIAEQQRCNTIGSSAQHRGRVLAICSDDGKLASRFVVRETSGKSIYDWPWSFYGPPSLRKASEPVLREPTGDSSEMSRCLESRDGGPAQTVLATLEFAIPLG